MTADTRTSGNATLSIFEGSRLVSSSEVYCCGYEGGRSAFWPHFATFCPECGEVWRREVYDYHFTYEPIPWGKWRVTESLCPACTRLAFERIMKEFP
jgi:hypothetical protein